MGGHRRLDRHDRHGTGQGIPAATTIRFDDPAEPPATRQQSVRDQPSLAARYELPAPASSNSSGSWGCMTGGRQGGCASFSLGPQQQSRRQRDLMGRRSDIHPAQPCGSVVHPIRQRASRPASQPASPPCTHRQRLLHIFSHTRRDREDFGASALVRRGQRTCKRGSPPRVASRNEAGEPVDATAPRKSMDEPWPMRARHDGGACTVVNDKPPGP